MTGRFLATPALLLFAGALLSQPASSSPEPGKGAPAAPQTRQSQEPPPAQTGPQDGSFTFEPPPELPVPEDYVQGRGYLGNFSDAWATDKFFDPVDARVFLALQDGAGRASLSNLDVPDLDLALEDLTLGRLVRETGGIFRPAFPLIREGTRKAFEEAVTSAADRAYVRLRPALKKFRKAARKEKVGPWLYALVWSEVLESKGAEEILVDAGALDPRRLRDEGYLWILAPPDPFSTGEDRYSSGSETLHYLWSPAGYLNPVVQRYATRRRILYDALTRLPWDEPETQETLEKMGILDSRQQVRVPVLRRQSRLLAALRRASENYARDVLAGLKPDRLSKQLGVARDEAVAAAFACTGYRILDRSVRDGYLSRPDYLARPDAPVSGLVETLVITENETSDPLERAYYLYDREDFQGSIKMADQFLRTHPGDAEGLFRKGIALMKLRKYPEALEVFRQAGAPPVAKLDVWRGWILIREGNIYDVMLKRDEALKKYQEALDYADVSGSHQTALNWLENIYRD